MTLTSAPAWLERSAGAPRVSRTSPLTGASQPLRRSRASSRVSPAPKQAFARAPGTGTRAPRHSATSSVSLASARAAYERVLEQADGRLDPERMLGLSDESLRAAGCSRQKTRYCRALAAAVRTGELPLGELDDMPDDEVRAHLQAIVGIGRWSADVYLLTALRRADVWPVGDLALVVALQRARRLAERPTPATMTRVGEDWRPWRSVAARLLWHEYLSR